MSNFFRFCIFFTSVWLPRKSGQNFEIQVSTKKKKKKVIVKWFLMGAVLAEVIFALGAKERNAL